MAERAIDSIPDVMRRFVRRPYLDQDLGFQLHSVSPGYGTSWTRRIHLFFASYGRVI